MLAGRAAIDWTAGRLTATGAGAPDPLAPSPEVARIGAERAARTRARAALIAAARAVPVADGGTVGSLTTDAGGALMGRLVTLAAGARALDVAHSSDGGVEVTLVLPLEALRSALAGSDALSPPAASETAPTALVIDAPGLTPALGVALIAGGTRLALPTVFHVNRRAAKQDARLGMRALTLRATGPLAAGGLSVVLEADALVGAARAGALVVLVTGGAE